MILPGNQLPQRKSPRFQGYDYAQSGAYFVTICTHLRHYLFGDVDDGVMQLNELGRIAHRELQAIQNHWDDVDLDLFVVMPNHVHAIIILRTVDMSRVDTTDAKNRVPTHENESIVGTAFLPSEKTPTKKHIPTLGQIIGNYKAGVTRFARKHGIHGDKIWQSRYHDHIIRNEVDLNRLREYTLYNPAKWETDTFYN